MLGELFSNQFLAKTKAKFPPALIKYRQCFSKFIQATALYDVQT